MLAKSRGALQRSQDILAAASFSVISGKPQPQPQPQPTPCMPSESSSHDLRSPARRWPDRIRQCTSPPSTSRHPLLRHADRPHRIYAGPSRRTHTAPFATSCSRSNAYRFPWHIPNPTPYDVLHLPRTATQPQVKARYYELVKELHPDRRIGPRVGSDPDQKGKAREQDNGAASATKDPDEAKLVEEFRIVVLAYELLSDSRKRRSYDRHGIGWDWSTASGAGANARGYGRSGMATRAEWEELMWRSAASRGSRGGRHRSPNFPFGFDPRHDATGWQRHASSSWAFYDAAGPRGGSGFAYRADNAGHGGGPFPGSDAFQGDFYWSNSNHATGMAAQGRYATNRRFIALVAIITWSLALFQFQRLSGQSSQATELADKKHRDAAYQLELARRIARSTEGKEKMEAMRAKAKEFKREQMYDLMASGQMSTGHLQLGDDGSAAAAAATRRAENARAQAQARAAQARGAQPEHLPALPPPAPSAPP